MVRYGTVAGLVPVLCAVLAATGLGPAFAAEGAAMPPELTFGSKAALANLSTLSATVARGPVNSVKVTFQPDDWPHLWFAQGKAYQPLDWSAAGAIAFDLRNPGSKLVSIGARVDSSARADGNVDCTQGFGTLAPGERATLVLTLGSKPTGMRGNPPYDVSEVAGARPARTMTSSGRAVDLKHIVAFQLFMDHPTAPTTVELYSVRWLPKQNLDDIVDRYGQFTRATWPGKLTSESQFAQRLKDEQAWIKAHPPFADRDKWGGWAEGPSLKATGFFRAALVRDGKEIAAPAFGEAMPAGSRWWLVTPTGHLFWSLGIDCVNTYASTPLKGREAMFTWLPPGAKKSGQANFYEANLKRKYGDQADTAWVKMAMERLPAWGFNTIGNWSQAAVFRAHKVPYTVPLGIGGLPKLAGTDCPDYLDPRFPGLVDRAIKAGTQEWRDDPWCLGYFVDNEIHWPGNLSAAKQTQLAERYFSTVSAAMNKYAPHQLYLGCRFASRPRAVVNVAAKYCDVVSFNIYEASVKPAEWGYVATLGKPILIGEFHFGALDRGMFSGGLGPRANQTARAQSFEDYVRSVLANPAFVGCGWFQYLDEPLTGRFDGENYNIGFVNVTDTPYRHMRDASRAVGRDLYQLADAAKAK